MAEFSFRLQRVLEYRESQEEEAKQHFLERKAACTQMEGNVGEIEVRRAGMLGEFVTSLVEHIELEARLVAIDDEERFAMSSLQVLRDEEVAAERTWLEQRREAEAVRKLRDKAYRLWMKEEARKEQIALDEWAIIRGRIGA